MTGVGATLFGRNGGRDLYYTDGELTIGVVSRKPDEGERPERLPNPSVVQMKEQLWTAIRPLLQAASE